MRWFKLVLENSGIDPGMDENGKLLPPQRVKGQKPRNDAGHFLAKTNEEYVPEATPSGEDLRR